MRNLTSSNPYLVFYDFTKDPNIIEVSEEEEEEAKNNALYPRKAKTSVESIEETKN